MEDVACHALQDGLDGVEVCRRVAADHQRRFAVVSCVHVCLCNGAVEQMELVLREFLAEGLRVEWRRGGCVDDDGSWSEGLRNPKVAEEDFPHYASVW